MCESSEEVKVEIVTYITSSLPVSIPSSSGVLQDLDGSLVLVAGGGELDLSLFEFRLVLALFLSHDHVSLCEIALDLEAVLLISIA